jgi:RNA polymerase sigma-70 factor (ECF subfamily)
VTESNGEKLKSLSSRPDPDPGLVLRAQEGDREALKDLLEEVGPAVRQWAYAHTGDVDSACDLSQEVLVLLLRKLRSYRGEARFLSWLFAVTRNQALEGLRRRGRRSRKMDRFKAEIGDAGTAVNDGGAGVDRQRLAELVRRLVADLPQRQREVFQMADLQGLTSPEIGTILKLSPVSVRAALLKARRSLRRRILENHPEFVEEYLG